jgi:ribosomal protein S17E
MHHSYHLPCVITALDAQLSDAIAFATEVLKRFPREHAEFYLALKSTEAGKQSFWLTRDLLKPDFEQNKAVLDKVRTGFCEAAYELACNIRLQADLEVAERTLEVAFTAAVATLPKRRGDYYIDDNRRVRIINTLVAHRSLEDVKKARQVVDKVVSTHPDEIKRTADDILVEVYLSEIAKGTQA